MLGFFNYVVLIIKNFLEVIIPDVGVGNKGPYSHLEDPKNVKAGKDFTAKQKDKIIEANKEKNGGVWVAKTPSETYSESINGINNNIKHLEK